MDTQRLGDTQSSGESGVQGASAPVTTEGVRYETGKGCLLMAIGLIVCAIAILAVLLLADFRGSIPGG
ncbi:MAG: hypothetical protein KF902_12890 [Phycisphaeraceae bacterium]|nr:hypothetical protein [Phycisphaeraceae bacterium]MCW5769084.1 hypothetical protein [Phycisphaeraceae bacterium]